MLQPHCTNTHVRLYHHLRPFNLLGIIFFVEEPKVSDEEEPEEEQEDQNDVVDSLTRDQLEQLC
jgi:hypothetical protein